MTSASRILCFTHAAPFRYGAVTSLLGVLPRLDRDRFRPFVVTQLPGAANRDARAAGIPTASLFRELRMNHREGFTRGALLLANVRMLRLIRRTGADLVYGHEAVSPLFCGAPARVAGVPFLYSPRSSWTDARRIDRYGWIPAGTRFGVAALLPNSRAVERSFGWLRWAKVRRVIYAGVDASRFARAERSEAVRRAVLGAGPDDVAIAAIGRIDRIKGQVDLVRAAPAVLREVPNARFAIVGTAPHARALGEVTREIRALGLEGRFALPGYVENAPALFRSTDIVVAPSRWDEALPRVTIEAGAAGVAIVATRVGGIPEAVAEDESALLVPRADPPALAAAIVRLARDPELRARFGAAGRRIVEERFGLDRYARELEAVFDEVLAGRVSAAR